MEASEISMIILMRDIMQIFQSDIPGSDMSFHARTQSYRLGSPLLRLLG